MRLCRLLEPDRNIAAAEEAIPGRSVRHCSNHTDRNTIEFGGFARRRLSGHQPSGLDRRYSRHPSRRGQRFRAEREMAGNVLYVEGRSLDHSCSVIWACSGQSEPHRHLYRQGGNRLSQPCRRHAECGSGGGGNQLRALYRFERGTGRRNRVVESGCATGTSRPGAILQAVEQSMSKGIDAVGGVGDPEASRGSRSLGICEAKSRIRPGALRRSLPI